MTNFKSFGHIKLDLDEVLSAKIIKHKSIPRIEIHYRNGEEDCFYFDTHSDSANKLAQWVEDEDE